MTRRADWVAALELFLRENSARPFVYGDWDCCLFVASAIEAMTGVDPAREFRGTYDSLRGAAEAMKLLYSSRTVVRVVEQIAVRYEMGELPVRFARRGDMVLIPRKRDSSPGIVAFDGARALVAGPTGVTTVPILAARRAWLVG